MYTHTHSHTNKRAHVQKSRHVVLRLLNSCALQVIQLYGNVCADICALRCTRGRSVSEAFCRAAGSAPARVKQKPRAVLARTALVLFPPRGVATVSSYSGLSARGLSLGARPGWQRPVTNMQQPVLASPPSIRSGRSRPQISEHYAALLRRICVLNETRGGPYYCRAKGNVLVNMPSRSRSGDVMPGKFRLTCGKQSTFVYPLEQNS